MKTPGSRRVFKTKYFENPMHLGASLSGLENLTSTLSLTIRDNQELRALSGLDNLQSVERPFVLGNNDSLTTLRALGRLQSVGFLDIFANDELTNLEGLERLEETEGME